MDCKKSESWFTVEIVMLGLILLLIQCSSSGSLLALPLELHRVHLTEKERKYAMPDPTHLPKTILGIVLDVHYI